MAAITEEELRGDLARVSFSKMNVARSWVQNTAYVGIADLFSVIKLFCGGLLFWFMVKFSLGRKLLTTRSSLELLLCSLSSFLFSRNTQVIIIQLNVLLSARPPPPGGLERHDSTQ
ncbi:hypothetical protein F7725_012220 [Dissostichus mawsoni]|uniref:Uncharacterized protein n=1 Tax=Dissostichus mawsoni TaxID=36200 RepID=A0A7J5YQ93_DISMA|nr:hypothetical protein F7725_012220 [Dissostichus mawsoni]